MKEAGQPAEQGELDRSGVPDERREDDVEEQSEDERGERLEQAQGDLEDEVAHPVRPPDGPGGPG